MEQSCNWPKSSLACKRNLLEACRRSEVARSLLRISVVSCMVSAFLINIIDKLRIIPFMLGRIGSKKLKSNIGDLLCLVRIKNLRSDCLITFVQQNTHKLFMSFIYGGYSVCVHSVSQIYFLTILLCVSKMAE